MGEFIEDESFDKSSRRLLKGTEKISGAGTDLIASTISGLPIYSLFKPLIDNFKDWKTRVELKQLAYFLKEFENLNQSERSEFSLMIQSNEEDFTERLFYYISQLNDKKKSEICGRIGVAYARKKIDSEQFMRLIQIVLKSNFNDLSELRNLILNYSSKGVDRFERFILPINMFTSSSIFNSVIKNGNNQIIWSLINMELAFQEIDFKGISQIGFASRQGILDVKTIADNLRNLKVNFRFTNEAYFLFHFGLNNL